MARAQALDGAQQRQQRTAAVDLAGVHDFDRARSRAACRWPATASKPFGTTKLRAGAARKGLLEPPAHVGVLSTRAALCLTRRASMRAPSHCVSQPRCHLRPVVGAPRIAIVEDQRPAQSPRDARARDQRGVRRRSGDHDSRRQFARDLERLARGRARPEIFEAHRREHAAQHGVGDLVQDALALERNFERRGAAVNRAGERQRVSLRGHAAFSTGRW